MKEIKTAFLDFEWQSWLFDHDISCVQNFPIPEDKLIKLAQKVLVEDEVRILQCQQNLILQSSCMTAMHIDSLT